ncbi:hypothetical protein OKW34_001970 [Paraburkholderia youngii]
MSASPASTRATPTTNDGPTLSPNINDAAAIPKTG